MNISLALTILLFLPFSSVIRGRFLQDLKRVIKANSENHKRKIRASAGDNSSSTSKSQLTKVNNFTLGWPLNNITSASAKLKAVSEQVKKKLISAKILNNFGQEIANDEKWNLELEAAEGHVDKWIQIYATSERPELAHMDALHAILKGQLLPKLCDKKRYDLEMLNLCMNKIAHYLRGDLNWNNQQLPKCQSSWWYQESWKEASATYKCFLSFESGESVSLFINKVLEPANGYLIYVLTKQFKFRPVDYINGLSENWPPNLPAINNGKFKTSQKFLDFI